MSTLLLTASSKNKPIQKIQI